MPGSYRRKHDPVTHALREELQERTVKTASGVEREFSLIGHTPTTEEPDEAIRALTLTASDCQALEQQIVERERRELADDTSSAESWDDLVKTPPSVHEHSKIGRRAEENEKRAHEILREARDVPARFTPPIPDTQVQSPLSTDKMDPAQVSALQSIETWIVHTRDACIPVAQLVQNKIMLAWAACIPLVQLAKEKLILTNDVGMNISMKWFIVALAALACYFLSPAVKYGVIDIVKFNASIEQGFNGTIVHNFYDIRVNFGVVTRTTTSTITVQRVSTDTRTSPYHEKLFATTTITPSTKTKFVKASTTVTSTPTATAPSSPEGEKTRECGTWDSIISCTVDLWIGSTLLVCGKVFVGLVLLALVIVPPGFIIVCIGEAMGLWKF